MNVFKAITGTVFLFLLSSAVFATAQDADILIYNGEEKTLFSNPLEEFYGSGNRERPEFMIEPLTVSSGNWRGYIATWEIAEGKLYLRKVASWLCPGSISKESCRKVTLEELFPGRVQKGRVSADWFTGELRVVDGERLRYVHAAYASIYERDILFDVSRGIVGSPRIIDNTTAPVPSELDLLKAEMARLEAKSNLEKNVARSELFPIHIVPGDGPFKVGTPRAQLEKVVGRGKPGSKYDDVYFVEYPGYGVQASFNTKTHNVHVIFLYPGGSDELIRSTVKTRTGIDWKSSEEDVLAAYGKPLKDYSDESKSWRRLEYPGIDFKFSRGQLDRIGILGSGGN